MQMFLEGVNLFRVSDYIKFTLLKKCLACTYSSNKEVNFVMASHG